MFYDVVLTVFKQSFVTTLTVGVHYIHGLAEHVDCNLSMNCSDKLIFGPSVILERCSASAVGRVISSY